MSEVVLDFLGVSEAVEGGLHGRALGSAWIEALLRGGGAEEVGQVGQGAALAAGVLGVEALLERAVAIAPAQVGDAGAVLGALRYVLPRAREGTEEEVAAWLARGLQTLHPLLLPAWARIVGQKGVLRRGRREVAWCVEHKCVRGAIAARLQLLTQGADAWLHDPRNRAHYSVPRVVLEVGAAVGAGSLRCCFSEPETVACMRLAASHRNPKERRAGIQAALALCRSSGGGGASVSEELRKEAFLLGCSAHVWKEKEAFKTLLSLGLDPALAPLLAAKRSLSHLTWLLSLGPGLDDWTLWQWLQAHGGAHTIIPTTRGPLDPPDLAPPRESGSSFLSAILSRIREALLAKSRRDDAAERVEMEILRCAGWELARRAGEEAEATRLLGDPPYASISTLRDQLATLRGELRLGLPTTTILSLAQLQTATPRLQQASVLGLDAEWCGSILPLGVKRVETEEEEEGGGGGGGGGGGEEGGGGEDVEGDKAVEEKTMADDKPKGGRAGGGGGSGGVGSSGGSGEGDEEDRVRLVQVATPEMIYLIDMHVMFRNPTKEEKKKLGEALALALFQPAPTVSNPLLVGFAVSGDVKALQPYTSPHMHKLERQRVVVDVKTHPKVTAHLKASGRSKKDFTSLAKMTECFYGKGLGKLWTMSDWSKRPLLPGQIEYAALDAWVPMDIAHRHILDTTTREGEAASAEGGGGGGGGEGRGEGETV